MDFLRQAMAVQQAEFTLRRSDEDGTYEISWTWLLGVVIYLIGTTSMALGANLQRYSMTKEDLLPVDERRPKMKQPWVVIGFILMVCSGIFLSVALIFASQTQLAPLILFIFLSNALFAHFLNKEPFYWKSDGLATVLVCSGVLACVITAPHNNEYYDNDAMKHLMSQWSFITFMCVTCAFIAIAWIFKWKTMKDCGGEIHKLRPNTLMMLQLAFGSLPGCFGGLNITLTKSTFSLIIGQVEDHGFVGIWISPLLYGLGFIVTVTYILQMKSTVDGLALCSAMIVISTQAVSEMITATMGGLLFFQDYKKFEAWDAAVFAVGIFLSLAGTFVLSYNRSFGEVDESESCSSDSDDSDEEIENGDGKAKEVNTENVLSKDLEKGADVKTQDHVVNVDGGVDASKVSVEMNPVVQPPAAENQVSKKPVINV
jgi:hypothetical protein